MFYSFDVLFNELENELVSPANSKFQHKVYKQQKESGGYRVLNRQPLTFGTV